ncbi:MAG TPA: bifunctional adenosylcobinamide kinase/adenosylcobinamide-phosphate guanylyltransferase [Aggregatilineaceae bacterium]|nr:bifunctional adenosylcobinamide kinase/adenosylcobinamide-phosphate guanylyltransferase [Aggregatilineaceae bacterium]
MTKLILILGGARSGKSTAAERMARQLGGESVLYVATAEAKDDEMSDRISAHQQQRPAGWWTLEAPVNVAANVSACLRDTVLPEVVLIDCITLLASNLLLTLPEDCSQAQVNQTILAEIDALLAVQKAHTGTWIVVSNEVGMGVVPPYPLGRLFRDGLGVANQRLAQAADEVILMVAGLPWHLREVGDRG